MSADHLTDHLTDPTEPVWGPVEPRTVRKAPWAALPGVSYEGTVLRRQGTITVEVRHCGHRHINLGPARKCSEALARKLNRPTEDLSR